MSYLLLQIICVFGIILVTVFFIIDKLTKYFKKRNNKINKSYREFWQELTEEFEKESD